MRTPLSPGELGKLARVTLGLIKFGCPNRPFWLICVFPHKQFGKQWEGTIIEQVGTFDPLPNERNEKLVALNLDRIRYWMAQNAKVEPRLLQLLGLSGFLPIHPLTFIQAKKMRNMGPMVFSPDSDEGTLEPPPISQDQASSAA